jgi:uncharacterized protein YceK
LKTLFNKRVVIALIKKTKHFMRGTLVVFLVVATSGCGTALGRGNHNGGVDANYFKGVQGSFQLLTGQLDGGYVPMALGCWISIICPVAVFYSLPIDAAIDTVLLPYDFFKS